MRISDWSSDVCSSDLKAVLQGERLGGLHSGHCRLQLLGDGAVSPVSAPGADDGRRQSRWSEKCGDSPWRPARRSCARPRSEEHTSELKSLMRTSYAVFCLKKKKYTYNRTKDTTSISSTTRDLLTTHMS